jgi:hypothetical protein
VVCEPEKEYGSEMLSGILQYRIHHKGSRFRKLSMSTTMYSGEAIKNESRGLDQYFMAKRETYDEWTVTLGLARAIRQLPALQKAT